MDKPRTPTAIIHAFSGSRLDRRHMLRHQTKRQVIIKLVADRAMVREDASGVALAYFEEAPSEAAVHLGMMDSETAVLAAAMEENETPSDHSLIDLRRLAMEGLLPPHELAMLAQARSLLAWHERHGYCSNCGQRTKAADAGCRRDCERCAAQHFPRTDPVVIVAVRSPRGWLLGRGAKFQPGMYSTLAGFMEPGESIEEAARREVYEETGIRLGAVTYHSSQPWPFPSSLMIGLIAQGITSKIAIDREELEDARWFTRDELVQMLENRHPQELKVPKPAAIAHHLIRASLLED